MFAVLPAAAFYFDLEAAFQTTPPLGVITWLVKEGAVVPQGVLWQCIHELKMEHPRSISRSQAIEFEVALLERAIHSGGRIRPVRARTKPQARSPDGSPRPRTELQWDCRALGAM